MYWREVSITSMENPFTLEIDIMDEPTLDLLKSVLRAIFEDQSEQLHDVASHIHVILQEQDCQWLEHFWLWQTLILPHGPD